MHKHLNKIKWAFPYCSHLLSGHAVAHLAKQEIKDMKQTSHKYYKMHKTAVSRRWSVEMLKMSLWVHWKILAASVLVQSDFIWQVQIQLVLSYQSKDNGKLLLRQPWEHFFFISSHAFTLHTLNVICWSYWTYKLAMMKTIQSYILEKNSFIKNILTFRKRQLFVCMDFRGGWTLVLDWMRAFIHVFTSSFLILLCFNTDMFIIIWRIIRLWIHDTNNSCLISY